jgi:toxin ParE1/3/4
MRIGLHPAAAQELHLAVDWYLAEAGTFTAARFIAEFEHLQAVILRNPQVGAPGSYATRKCIFRSFPYTVVYRAAGERIDIVAVAHHSRRPNYWSSRK